MSRKSPSQLKILNDTLDIVTLMTHGQTVYYKNVLKINGLNICISRRFFIPLQ
jgi:hypothetical protein